MYVLITITLENVNVDMPYINYLIELDCTMVGEIRLMNFQIYVTNFYFYACVFLYLSVRFLRMKR